MLQEWRCIMSAGVKDIQRIEVVRPYLPRAGVCLTFQVMGEHLRHFILESMVGIKTERGERIVTH